MKLLSNFSSADALSILSPVPPPFEEALFRLRQAPAGNVGMEGDRGTEPPPPPQPNRIPQCLTSFSENGYGNPFSFDLAPPLPFLSACAVPIRPALLLIPKGASPFSSASSSEPLQRGGNSPPLYGILYFPYYRTVCAHAIRPDPALA